MTKQITIEPLTRIEGHAKITVHLNEDGVVEHAYFHASQFRGFEKFCEGRPFYEMPSLFARTCGICPVSHLIAGAKACDNLLAVQIPPTARDLRRVMNLAQIMQSHALSYFYLSLPDLLLGMDASPGIRNLVGVLQENPAFARDGIRVRQIGQQIIELLGGKRIHPAWIVPGGVNEPLTVERRDAILAKLPDAIEITKRALKWHESIVEKFNHEIKTFANFPSLYVGLVDTHGNLEHYDGHIRIMDSAGNIIVDQLDTLRYAETFGEACEDWTYMKFPYYKAMGYPKGMYRVGPLARLNIVNACGTEQADIELKKFRSANDSPVQSSFHYHWARLIEILYAAERIEQILTNPEIFSQHVRAHASPNSFDGLGITEAPRGLLIHHYRIDEHGLITWANLIVATGHNNAAMNRGVLQVAKNYVDGNKLQEGMLNRVEAVIRAFDPCLSCSTHILGKSSFKVELVSHDGKIVDSI